MNKIYLPLTVAAAALMVPMRAPARTLTPAEALNRIASAESNGPVRAASIGGTSARLVLKDAVRSEKAVDPAMYVFQSNADGSYVIASADDAFPAVIGYPSHYSSDPDSIAPGLQWYLQTVAANIEAVRAGAASADTSTDDSSYRADWTDISNAKDANGNSYNPVWHQSSPYNSSVPKVDNIRSKVGCVAVAMGQVMLYHRHPAQGTGYNSYIVNSTNSTNNRSFDHTYDWANMTRDLQSSSTDAEKTAVRTLVADVGCSVEMQYKSKSATAQTIRTVYALTTYFGYSKGMRYHWQGFDLNQAQWETEIYNSLKNYGPVIYGGAGLDDDGEDHGHAFVCDGYRKSDNTFHINWGWGWRNPSAINDWFNLTVLEPQSTSEGSNYSHHQLIITGVRPATDGETAELQEPVVGFFGDLKYGTYDGNSNCFYTYDNDVNSTKSTTRDRGFNNLSPKAEQIQFGIIARNCHGGKMYLIHSVDVGKYDPKDGVEYIQLPLSSLKTKLPGVLPYSTYTLHPAYRIVSDNTSAAAKIDGDGDLEETGTPYDLPDGWKIMGSQSDHTTHAWMNVFPAGDSRGIEVSLNENGLTTGVTDIASEGGADADTVLQVVRPDGTVVAVSPDAAQLDALPAGLYIYVTPAGPRKVLHR